MLRTLKLPSHESRKQTAKAVHISVSRLNRAGAAKLDNTIGALNATLATLPGAVVLATRRRYNEIKTQYARNVCMRSRYEARYVTKMSGAI